MIQVPEEFYHHYRWTPTHKENNACDWNGETSACVKSLEICGWYEQEEACKHHDTTNNCIWAGRWERAPGKCETQDDKNIQCFDWVKNDPDTKNWYDTIGNHISLLVGKCMDKSQTEAPSPEPVSVPLTTTKKWDYDQNDDTEPNRRPQWDYNRHKESDQARANRERSV